MARMVFRASDEYELKLSRLAYKSPEIVKAAIYAGAKVLADAVNSAIRALPTDVFRFLRDGDKYSGPTEQEKADLEASFGITPISQDKNGDWNTKIGFDGYGSIPTNKYPSGVPNQLVARAIESGSSVRKKTPFMRPTVSKKRKAVEEAMARAADEAIAEIMK